MTRVTLKAKSFSTWVCKSPIMKEVYNWEDSKEIKWVQATEQLKGTWWQIELMNNLKPMKRITTARGSGHLRKETRWEVSDVPAE